MEVEKYPQVSRFASEARRAIQIHPKGGYYVETKVDFMFKIWNSKDMKEKGFAPIIFVLGVLVISGLVIGSSFYIKNNMALNKKLTISPTPVLENLKVQSSIKQDNQVSDSTKDKLDATDEVLIGQLLSCSNDIENIKCPEGYTCYHAVPGGMAPPNISPEPTSGDKRCHKDCISDKDCPVGTPICVKKTIQIGDVTGPNKNICFSQDEGLKAREERYQECLASKGTRYDEIVKGKGKSADQSIIVILSSEYSAEILTKELGLSILKEGKNFGNGLLLYSVMPSDKSKENFLKTACQLDLDARINNVNVVYKGEYF